MRVIVLASQKGGSGKTTLAGHLAVQAELSGAGPVALIDTDPQGSLAKWWNAREAETPAFVGARFDSLQSDIEALRMQGFKMVFIDTPPAVTKAISHVVSFADLVVMPTRPSPHDLRAVGATVEIAAAHNKAMVFVINAATARAKITAEAAVALSQHGTVAPVMLNHRVDFAASMTDGRTVMEYSAKGASSKEVRELWGYLSGRLAKLDGGLADISDPAGFDFEEHQSVSPKTVPQPVLKQGGSLVALSAVNEEVAPVKAPAVEEIPAAIAEVLRDVIEAADVSAPETHIPESYGLEVRAPEGRDSKADVTFDADSAPPSVLENPQQALLEAVQRLRGELDYPVSLEDILNPENGSGETLRPEQILKEMAPPKRGLSAPFLNRMIGFGRRA